MSRIDEIRARLSDYPDVVLEVRPHENPPHFTQYLLLHEGDDLGEAYLEGDAQLWAHSYSDLHYLLAELDKLRSENEWLKSKLPF
jgi:hypothetical protein